MATLYQYYSTDFSNTVRMHVNFPVKDQKLEAVVLFDFVGYLAYAAFYVPGKDHKLEFFLRLLKALEYGKTQVEPVGLITLPAAKQFPGQIRVENKESLEIFARFHGDPTWISAKKLQASRRVFIYCEAEFSQESVAYLKEEAEKLGHDIQIRSTEYMNTRTKFEQPLAFISHDSRDKDVIARKIAVNLKGMLCPVWYDEFSLKIGDNLRENIEKGLKECKKCILILSPNFLSNSGWTRKEFDSIFTREILEDKKLVLPVWYQVSKQQVYEYCPSLLNVKGANWDQLGEEEICRQLNRAITE